MSSNCNDIAVLAQFYDDNNSDKRKRSRLKRDTDKYVSGSGKECPISGFKAEYVRRPGVVFAFYASITNCHDSPMYKVFVGVFTEEFEALSEHFDKEQLKPVDARYRYCNEENEMRTPRKRAISEKVMLFLFLHALRGRNEGGIGLRQLAFMYGISCGTISNFICHVAWALHKVLSKKNFAKIEWPDKGKCKCQEGMVCGFSKAVGFVDGTKVKT